MTSTALTRRAVTVSTGALALCLFANGVALADTGLPPAPSVPGVPTAPSVPGVPSPDNVVTTIDQTVKQLTTSTPPSTTPPATTTPTTATPATTARKPVAAKPVSKPVGKPATKSARSNASRAAAQQFAALSNWSPSSVFGTTTPTNIAL